MAAASPRPGLDGTIATPRSETYRKVASSFGRQKHRFLPKIAWETDAWARLGADHTWSSNGNGQAGVVVQGKHGAPDGRGAGESWMHNWTIFYWGWWISWAPFVGTFIARISKGRTLGEFIVFTLILPTLYCIYWMGVFGAEGLRMQSFRRADISPMNCGDADVAILCRRVATALTCVVRRDESRRHRGRGRE